MPSSKHTIYENKTEELLKDIVSGYGVEIYDVDYVKEGKEYYLRVFIDKPGGVTIDDCEDVSRALSDKLDEEDFIPDAYILEVSSPGLGRALTKDRHLDRSIGSEVDIKLYKPMDDSKNKEISGILKSYDKDVITIESESGNLDIDRSLIAQIRLAFDF